MPDDPKATGKATKAGPQPGQPAAPKVSAAAPRRRATAAKADPQPDQPTAVEVTEAEAAAEARLKEIQGKIADAEARRKAAETEAAAAAKNKAAATVEPSTQTSRPFRGPSGYEYLALCAMVLGLIVAGIFMWYAWPSDSDDNTGSQQQTSGLTETQVRAIAIDAANTAIAANPAITQDQAQKMIDKAVADAAAQMTKTGGLTEAQVRSIVNDTLKNFTNGGGSKNTAAFTSDPQGTCHIIHDSLVDQWMDHVSSSGSHIHLEYWTQGQPERETLLPTAGVPGGRWDIPTGIRGWVWEYDGCSDQQVADQISAHITRRLAGGFNNAGYVSWDKSPAKPHSGSPAVPAVTVGSGSPSAASQSTGGNCTVKAQTYNAQTDFTVTGPAIVNAWSDKFLGAGVNVKVMVPQGTSATFLSTGGESWEYPACYATGQISAEFAKNGNTEKSLDSLKSTGQVK